MDYRTYIESLIMESITVMGVVNNPHRAADLNGLPKITKIPSVTRDKEMDEGIPEAARPKYGAIITPDIAQGGTPHNSGSSMDGFAPVNGGRGH